MEQIPSPAAAKAEARLPLLSLLTFSPLGNPLTSLSPAQCNLFFDYLMLSLHNQRKEQQERIAALNKRIVLPASISAAATRAHRLPQEQKARQAQLEAGMQENREKSAQEGRAVARKAKWEELSAEESKDSGTTGAHGAEGMVGWRARQMSAKQDDDKESDGGTGPSGVAGWKFSSLFRKQGAGKKGEGGGEGGAGAASRIGSGQAATSMAAFNATFGQKSGEVSSTIEHLVMVIDDYARGDAEKERKVVEDWQDRLRAEGYKADDLMASLLLVIEDNAWSGEEGGLGTAKPPAGATRLASVVPKRLRSAAQESAVMRLASVREMLRYYFDTHPQDYQAALAAALGISPDDEEDAYALQERLAYELASIGSFALAQKILSELKRQKGMGTKECLMKLGYRYDVKRKRLVIGKRTCGKPAEARGIVDTILASARKKPKN
jgi:hypothetical protein